MTRCSHRTGIEAVCAIPSAISCQETPNPGKRSTSNVFSLADCSRFPDLFECSGEIAGDDWMPFDASKISPVSNGCTAPVVAIPINKTIARTRQLLANAREVGRPAIETVGDDRCSKPFLYQLSCCSALTCGLTTVRLFLCHICPSCTRPTRSLRQLKRGHWFHRLLALSLSRR